jgi:uncharacterized tellurite resistance protein B-like protein
VFGRFLERVSDAESLQGAEQLVAVVRRELPDADDDAVQVVTAIAGLLGVVAYADRDYSQVEEDRVREELGRVHGMTASGARAICAVLREHVLEVATVQASRYCRALRELADLELKRDVLQVLVEVAAAEGEISLAEVNVLRQTTQALGLDQSDYNDAQARHRDKLAFLR